MKPVLLTLLCLLLIVMAAHARHRAAQSDDIDLTSDSDDSTRERTLKHRQHSAEQLRNRRRRWQGSYDDYYHSSRYPDYPQRRYDNRQENLLPEILRLLDEISSYVKRPPPPPQPIYVPYPVPYPVFQNCVCKVRSNYSLPNVTRRWPEMEDPRQNWGFVTSDNPESKANDEDYVDDSVRPVAFVRNSLNHPGAQNSLNAQRSPPQAGPSVKGQRTRDGPNRRTANTGQTITGACDAATISCCKPNDTFENQADCFNNFKCGRVFGNGEACNQANILAVLDRYSRTYGGS